VFPRGRPKRPRSLKAQVGRSRRRAARRRRPLSSRERRHWSFISTYQIEVQRQAALDGLIFGAAVDVGPVFYLRVMGTAGLSITSSLDVVARLSLHVVPVPEWDPDFVAATIGVRVRLP
jgi:hypothetical protein